MKVLKVRRLQENICRGEIAKIQQAILEKETEIKQNLASIEEGRQKLSSAAGFSSHHYRQFVSYEESLRFQNSSLSEEITENQTALEEKKVELRQHALETKKLEKDEERKLRDWQKEFKAEEQKTFDDIASRKRP